MSEVRQVTHMIPTRFVPRRGRAVRFGFAHDTVPVSIRTFDRHDLQAAGPISVHGLAPHVHDGEPGVWSRFPFGLDGLCRADAPVSFPLAALCLARSPFAPSPAPTMPERQPVPPGDGRRSTQLDMTEQCRADLASWIEANMRLVDGHPWVRVPGPFVTLVESGSAPTFRHDARAWGEGDALRSTPVELAPALWAFRRGQGLGPFVRQVDPPAPEASGWPDSVTDREGARLYCNLAASAVLGAACAAEARIAANGAVPRADFEAALPETWELGCRGMLGTIRAGESCDVAERIAVIAPAVADQLLSLGSMLALDTLRLGMMAREAILPAIERSAEPGADEDALADIGPAP